MSQHSSDYSLYAFLAGELDAAAEKSLQAHLDTCSDCRQRVVALRSERAEFQSQHPNLGDLPRRDPAAGHVASRGGIRASLAWGSVVLFLLVGGTLWWVLDRGSGGRTGTSVGIKGGVLRWVVERDGKQVEADPGFVFRAGDRLGWTLQADGRMSVAVFSLDSRGRIRTLGPEPYDRPAFWVESSQSEPSAFSFSLRVTEPLEQERILVLLSPDKLEVNDLLRELSSHMENPADETGFRKWAEKLDSIQVDSRLIEGR